MFCFITWETDFMFEWCITWETDFLFDTEISDLRSVICLSFL